MKEGKYAISGQFPRLVPVLNRGGTGTTHQNMNGIDIDAVPMQYHFFRQPSFLVFLHY